jgi:hypothetical protein
LFIGWFRFFFLRFLFLDFASSRLTS